MSEVSYFRLNGFPWTDPLLVKDVPSKSIKQHTSCYEFDSHSKSDILTALSY
jgi:hypothetical protein